MTGSTGRGSFDYADFQAGNPMDRSAYWVDANKTFDPPVSGASDGCNSIGVPGRASRARPPSSEQAGRAGDAMRLLGPDGRRDVLPITGKHGRHAGQVLDQSDIVAMFEQCERWELSQLAKSMIARNGCWRL